MLQALAQRDRLRAELWSGLPEWRSSRPCSAASVEPQPEPTLTDSHLQFPAESLRPAQEEGTSLHDNAPLNRLIPAIFSRPLKMYEKDVLLFEHLHQPFGPHVRHHKSPALAGGFRQRLGCQISTAHGALHGGGPISGGPVSGKKEA